MFAMKKSEVKDLVAPKKSYKYKVKVTNQFKKDVVLASKSGLNLEVLQHAVEMLASDGGLPPEYKTHSLKGKGFANCLECHLQPNWLLIWMQDDKNLIIMCVSTGSHAYLFGM
ncbi:RelE/StbE family addiction module toxin [Bacteroidia bacterium]|nr:RelE/StbE family addiction module toxin [Bacteroidia bacterium]